MPKRRPFSSYWNVITVEWVKIGPPSDPGRHFLILNPKLCAENDTVVFFQVSYPTTHGPKSDLGPPIIPQKWLSVTRIMQSGHQISFPNLVEICMHLPNQSWFFWFFFWHISHDFAFRKQRKGVRILQIIEVSVVPLPSVRCEATKRKWRWKTNFYHSEWSGRHVLWLVNHV